MGGVMGDLYHIDKARVRHSFSRAAHTYDAAAVVQKLVRDEMLSRLDLVNIQPRTILDAGCGTGAASHALQKRFKHAQVVSLDFAFEMLQQTRKTNVLQSIKQLFLSGRHNTVCGDIEALPLADASIGFAWSNLAIQWCNDLDQAFREFHRVLRPESLFMFSTFGPDTLRELRVAADSATANTTTSVSRFIDMHDIGDALVRAGFSAPVLDVERFTLTYDDVKSVMRDLKSIGAHNATDGRSRGLLGRGFLQKLESAYEQFRSNGKLPATFEVVYGHAWRAVDKPDLGAGVSPIAFTPRRTS
jgi:malonyl-CoA O-methyltransferase